MGSRYEWQVLLDDAEWAQEASLDSLLGDAVVEKPSGRRRLPGNAGKGFLAVAVLAILAGGLVVWRQAQMGLAVMEREVQEVVAAEEALQGEMVGSARVALLDREAPVGWLQEMAAREGSAGVSTVTDIDLLGDRAMVRLRTASSEQPFAYGESRFYRETATGWVRTPVDEGFWGSEQSMESEFFVFHFRRRDGAAVMAAAGSWMTATGSCTVCWGWPSLPRARQWRANCR